MLLQVENLERRIEKKEANNTGLHCTTRFCHPPHTTSGSEPVNYSEFLTKNYNTLKINLINQL